MALNGYGVGEDEKEEIKTSFGVTNSEVNERIKDLKKWAASLPQLPPESLDENFLNIMLLRSKFKDDLVKTNIENYFKTILKYSEIFAKLGKFNLTEEVGVAIPSPKLTSSWERIGILKLSPKNLATKSFDINQMILVTVTTGIIMYNYDYVPSVRFLLDFEGFTLMDLLKVNIKDLFKLVHICENMLKIRISGIELFNAPRLVSGLLSIARILLKPKMVARISVHPNLNSIYKNIPKSCLPSDYGGELQSTDTLTEKWDIEIKSHQSFFDKISKMSAEKCKQKSNSRSLKHLSID